MKIYLAGSLFSEAERAWLASLKKEIEEKARCEGKDTTVIWPWELFAPGEVESMGCNAPREIFRRCRDSLDICDTVVASMDGPIVDDGTAWELGYAYASRKRIIGIRTDIRRAGECEGSCVNAMIEHSCEKLVKSVRDLLLVLFDDPGSISNISSAG